MLSELNEKVDAAVTKMYEQVKASQDGQKALHYSQADLNLAHSKSILNGIPSPSTVAASAAPVSETSSSNTSQKS